LGGCAIYYSTVSISTGIVFDHGEADPRTQEQGRSLIAAGYAVYCGSTQPEAHMRAAEAYLDLIFPNPRRAGALAADRAPAHR
jgi:hypothetical protein